MRRAENLGAADGSVTEIWLRRWLARKLSARADGSAVQPGGRRPAGRAARTGAARRPRHQHNADPLIAQQRAGAAAEQPQRGPSRRRRLLPRPGVHPDGVDWVLIGTKPETADRLARQPPVFGPLRILAPTP